MPELATFRRLIPKAALQLQGYRDYSCRVIMHSRSVQAADNQESESPDSAAILGPAIALYTSARDLGMLYAHTAQRITVSPHLISQSSERALVSSEHACCRSAVPRATSGSCQSMNAGKHDLRLPWRASVRPDQWAMYHVSHRSWRVCLLFCTALGLGAAVLLPHVYRVRVCRDSPFSYHYADRTIDTTHRPALSSYFTSSQQPNP